MKHWLIIMILLGLSLPVFGQTCASFPCVLASVSVTNQSQGIRSTPLFAPATAGLFRVSAYMSTSSGILPAAMWGYEIGWKDDQAGRSSGLAAISRNSAAPFSVIVQSQAGQPITYLVKPIGVNGQLGGMTYNFSITLEQLQ